MQSRGGLPIIATVERQEMLSALPNRFVHVRSWISSWTLRPWVLHIAGSSTLSLHVFTCCNHNVDLLGRGECQGIL